MTDERMSGLALIAGSVAGIITMSLHPSGRDFAEPGQLERVMYMNVAVHSLALASLPMLFLGAMGLSRRVASGGRLAIAALVMYAFAIVAVMNAAAVSGLVAPTLIRRIVAAGAASSDGWQMLMHYNFWLNQAFAQVFVAASSAAIVLWSAAILRTGSLARGVAIYGCVLGPIAIIALLSGHLNLGVHGMGLVVLGQAIWFISVGVLLCRIQNA